MGLSYWRDARLVLDGADAAALLWALGSIGTSGASWWGGVWRCGRSGEGEQVAVETLVDRWVFGRSCCLGWLGAGGVETWAGPVRVGTWVRVWVRA